QRGGCCGIRPSAVRALSSPGRARARQGGPRPARTRAPVLSNRGPAQRVRSVDARVLIAGLVLEDTDRGLGRVAGLVERDATGVAVVVRDAAADDDLGARDERLALLTVTRAARDFLQLAGHVGRVGRVRRESSEREEDDGVVGL